MITPPMTPQQQNSLPFDPAQAIRNLQIIRSVYPFGVLAFFCFALVMKDGPLQFDIDILQILALGMAVTALGALVVWDRIAMKKNPIPTDAKLSDDETTQFLMQTIISSEIVKGAMLEGAAFFGLMSLFIENSGIGMLIGILLAVVLVVTIPTTGRIQNKLENLRHQLRC